MQGEPGLHHIPQEEESAPARLMVSTDSGALLLMTVASFKPNSVWGVPAVAVAAALAFWGGPASAGILLAVMATFVLGYVGLRSIQFGSTVRPAAFAPASNAFTPLFPWVIGAIVIRWIAAIFLNATDLWLHFAPDAYFYELAGEAIRESWNSPAVDLSLWFGQSTALFYPYLNAFIQVPFGSSRYPLSFINGVIGVLAGYNFSLLARSLYGPRAQRRVFLLAAFFPSLIIWSSMSIRESWSWLALSIVLFSGQKLRERFSITHMVGLILGMVWLSLLRTYLVPFVVLGLVLSFLTVRARQVPYVAVGCLLMVVFLGVFGDRLGIHISETFSEESLETVDTMRRNLAYGGSAYGSRVDTTTFMGALLYFPEGVARFLLSPVPWTISSWRQAIALPETMVWAFFLYQAVREIMTSIRSDISRMALLVFVIALVTGAYGLVSGNEGTAYRHRAQVMLPLFVLAAGWYVRRMDVSEG